MSIHLPKKFRKNHNLFLLQWLLFGETFSYLKNHLLLLFFFFWKKSIQIKLTLRLSSIRFATCHD